MKSIAHIGRGLTAGRRRQSAVPGWVALAGVTVSLFTGAVSIRADAPVIAVPAPPKVATTAGESSFVPSVYKTFAEWKAACDRLPSNRTLKLTLPRASLLPLKDFGQFTEVLDAFFQLCKTNALANDKAWLGAAPVRPDFFNTDATYFLKPQLLFQPFVERELVSPGGQVFFHGDLHGDVHSLVAWVNWLNENGYVQDFKIARPNVYLVFLGDYTDRGMYGVEVLYTMLRLKVANPEHVFMVRGNHEDVSLVTRYGFMAEGRGKYGQNFDAKHVLRLYDFLPVALYLGCETNVIQCNHGGVEPGFDPKRLLDAPESAHFQLLGRLNQQRFLKGHPKFAQGMSSQARRLMDSTLIDFQPDTPTSPAVIGFMWNDFSVVRGEPQFDYDPGRAFIYGENPTKVLLTEGSGAVRQLRGIFRAHQQATILNSMMRRLLAGHGVYRHWQDTDSVALLNADVPKIAEKIELSQERRVPPQSVWTFNVVPDSVYGEALDYTFDTFGLLTMASAFEDWRLRIVNQTIAK